MTDTRGKPTISGDGFARFEPVEGVFAQSAQVFESSRADGPHLLVMVTQPTNLNEPWGPKMQAGVEFPLDAARVLVEQLQWLIDNHYQVKDRYPEGENP